MRDERQIVSGITVKNIKFNYNSQAAEKQASVFFATILEVCQDSGDNLYLLTDPAVLLQRTDSPFVQTLVSHNPVPVPLPHQSLSAGDYPWLLALDITSSDDLALLHTSIVFALNELHPDSLCQGLGRGICGWLTSGAKPAGLIKQLGHTAIQKQPDHNPVLVRYYDPAVHSLLWPQLSELQQRRMAGVISGWLFPDGDGQPVIHRSQPSPVLHSTFSLGLNTGQCHFILGLCGTINRVLRRYRQLHIAELRYSEQSAALYLRHALTRQAGHPALRQEADRLRFALLLLEYHPQIDLHPKVADLLDRDTFSDDAGWATRTRTITPETWQRWASELNESPIMEQHP